MIGLVSRMVGIPIISVIMCVFINYIAFHFYARYCTSYGIFGFIENLFTMASPSCKALLYIQTATTDFYLTLLSSLSISFIAMFSTIIGSNQKCDKIIKNKF